MSKRQFYLSLILFVAFMGALGINWNRVNAAGSSTIGITSERELGVQKLTPTSATALAVPQGTLHAEFHITGGSVWVRWNGQAPVDSGTSTSWGAFPWPEGHFRKEENDNGKLANWRGLCADCTVWVNYFGRR